MSDYPHISDWLSYFIDETNEKQKEWAGEMRLAIVKKTYYSGPPWQNPRRYIREGDICYIIPAHNQPADGHIQYWTVPVSGLEDWAPDALGAYGIGHSAADIEIL